MNVLISSVQLKWAIRNFLFLSLMAFIFGCQNSKLTVPLGNSQSASSSGTPEPTLTPIPTAVPSPSPTPPPGSTPKPTATPTPVITPIPTPVPTPTGSSTPAPTPLPPVGDQVTITNTLGTAQTNQPVSISRPFIRGEITSFAQASAGGTALLTQCDVKNRWPDGSLKFAVVSFIIPSISAGGSVTVSFFNQTTGNNTGYLTQTNMLGSSYNFDGQIQLSGTASHNISARNILNTAGSCNDPGTDIDSGKYMCTYWLKGPIVTAVILEDRLGRSFDVNTDGLGGNPLHPIFEAWFYPQGNLVQLGYTLEDSWASATAANSARDQTYSYVLTAGNTSPKTVYTQSTEAVITRTRWHHTFCASGSQNTCYPGVHINNNYSYLAQTKFFPHWDPTFTFATSGTGIPTPTNFVAAWNNSYTNKTDALVSPSSGQQPSGIGFFPSYLANCGNSNALTTGDSCTYSGNVGFDIGGAAYYHGPLTTWDIVTLMSQDPNMINVTLGSADVGGGVPYWFREADTAAQIGNYFDSPNNNIQPQGRVISINARVNLDTEDVTTTQPAVCSPNYPSQYVNYGGSGQDLGPFAGQLDTSHWPELSFTAYLLSGQYAYYEELMMQGANAIGNVGGAYACPGWGGHRQAALGYWNYLDGDRSEMWNARETALCAFMGIDGSPEAAYCLDKLKTNLAVLEANHGIPCDIPGSGIQEPYCGTTTSSAWGFGNISRGGTTENPNDYQFIGTPLGTAFGGVTAYVGEGGSCGPGDTGCTPAFAENSNFMNDYSAVMLGWINDLGFCPQTNGVCQLLQATQNWYINAINDPSGPGMYVLGDYVFPTVLGTGSTPITSLAAMKPVYGTFETYPRPSSVWGTTSCSDEGYAAESTAALSYGYNLTSTANPGYTGPVGYSGSASYNKMRAALISSCTYGGPPFTLSPKWDITPRQ